MGERLYTVGQPADEAFLLRSGEVEYWITESDFVIIGGSNIIVGASEILIAMNRKEAVQRHMTLVKRPDAVINRIPAEKLASFVTTYAIGFSVAHHLAETITSLHKVLTSKMNKLHETERFSRDLSKAYVEILQFLEQESKSQHFPWLFSLVEKGKATNIYNFGLAFTLKGEEKQIDVHAKKLAQYRQVYPKGSVICREGETAEDMYILMEGRIEVRIKNNPIDIITKKGTIIGEMGLILGAPRTATLRALEDVHVVKIGSRDMESIFKNDPGTFFDMLSSLAFRELDNCEMIREYSEMVNQVSAGKGENTLAQVSGFAAELAGLMSELDKVSQQNPDLDWLEQIRELANRKVHNLLSQVSLVTGESYDLGGRSTPAGPAREKETPVKKSDRPVRDNSLPKIDWF